MITCSVRSYAILPRPLQGFKPGSRFDVTVPDGTTLARLIEDVLRLPEDFVLLMTINGRVASLDDVIQSADRIDLFPPPAGG